MDLDVDVVAVVVEDPDEASEVAVVDVDGPEEEVVEAEEVAVVRADVAEDGVSHLGVLTLHGGSVCPGYESEYQHPSGVR